jgi:hypothetical protein
VVATGLRRDFRAAERARHDRPAACQKTSDIIALIAMQQSHSVALAARHRG